MPPDKSTIIIKSFLFLNQNICCVYSKEPSFFWASNTYVLIDYNFRLKNVAMEQNEIFGIFSDFSVNVLKLSICMYVCTGVAIIYTKTHLRTLFNQNMGLYKMCVEKQFKYV